MFKLGIAFKIIAALGLCAVLFAFGCSSFAQGSDATATAEGAVPPNSKLVESFLEARLEPLVEEGVIPGAVITIVEGDRITVLRGLGYADIERRIPLDPRRTLVRIGSISKSFTAVAIHQLIQEGRISLDADANEYLRTEHIPEKFGAPVTVRDLLSHQAGFDGNISYVSSTRRDETQPGQGWISRQLRRLRPAGQVFAYDNSAYAVLGQILVDQEGMPYGDVIKKRIFEPLGMRNSVIGIPVDREGEIATCYNRASGELVVCEHQLLMETYGAAGDISLTGEDMGKFLIALLNKGEANGARILEDAEFNAFSSISSRLHEDGPGVALGAYEMGPPGHHVFGHSGGIRGGSSFYAVMPEEDIAVFVSINASLSTDVISTLSGIVSLATAPSVENNFDPGDLMTYEFPAAVPGLFNSVPDTGVSEQHCALGELEGEYQYLRATMFSSLTMRLLGPLALTPVEVERLEDGSWRIEGEGPYDEISPCLFKLRGASYADGQMSTLIGFTKTEDGTIIGGSHPLAAWAKVPWHASAMISVVPYFVSILGLIIIGLAGSVFSSASRRLHVAALGGGVLLLLGLVCEMQFETPVYQYGGHVLPVLAWRIALNIGLVLIAFSVILAVRRMVSRGRGVPGRITVFLIVTAGVISLLLSAYWGVLGKFL
ncbi:hypothetical protein HY29_05270 [Hyphomonas beringensis]|uniref:Beta-lactamase-related domain-containing protein n=1 Tax=Hyphomonas beringensis TaxID=1280946 RepID=A0A062U5P8_9PROT|nr:serine hydrolase domain-containing protein [Hyphomonas beringensis]KCZ51949.1 hypothetical protein HY29_05270 [Hyphomonas beringensis]